MSTLQNEMLFQNFIKKVEKLNPDSDIDPEIIDRTLEPDEALMALKKMSPDLNIGLAKDAGAGFREFLDDYGISNKRVQNLVAMLQVPLSEQELGQLAYLLNSRPEHAVRVDRALKAPLTKDPRVWIKNPNRVDLPTVDTVERK